MIEAWHFVGATLRDGRPVPPDGEWLEHDGPLVLCSSGLHASERLIDALLHAPDSTLCRVTLDGEIVRDHDKICARRRRIEWRMDAEDLLRRFARNEALRVIDLWDAPAVVRQYLETGDVGLRAAAWRAADVTDAAAVTCVAAKVPAWSAADSARGAATTPAWLAAAAAARAAAWSTAYSAQDSAQYSVWVAASDAAWDAADKRLTAMALAERAAC